MNLPKLPDGYKWNFELYTEFGRSVESGYILSIRDSDCFDAFTHRFFNEVDGKFIPHKFTEEDIESVARYLAEELDAKLKFEEFIARMKREINGEE